MQLQRSEPSTIPHLRKLQTNLSFWVVTPCSLVDIYGYFGAGFLLAGLLFGLENDSSMLLRSVNELLRDCMVIHLRRLCSHSHGLKNLKSHIVHSLITSPKTISYCTLSFQLLKIVQFYIRTNGAVWRSKLT
jgi:hypothetical protein